MIKIAGLGDQFEWSGLHWVVADVVDWQATKIDPHLPAEEKTDVSAE